jgi:hypothetical protein
MALTACLAEGSCEGWRSAQYGLIVVGRPAALLVKKCRTFRLIAQKPHL